MSTDYMLCVMPIAIGVYLAYLEQNYFWYYIPYLYTVYNMSQDLDLNVGHFDSNDVLIHNNNNM